MMPPRIFIGVDSRAIIAHHVLEHSILRRASMPVAITPLMLSTLPITRRGLTEFSVSRWLVPYLCDYEGVALFLDSDIICRCDVAEVLALIDVDKPITMVAHEGKLAFERPSVMGFSNALCRHLTPDHIERGGDTSMMWRDGASFAQLPKSYNFLVGYEQPTDPPPQIVHYTAGVPLWPETRGCDYADLYHAELDDMRRLCSWPSLMGSSVHVPQVMERLARERAHG